MKTKSPQLSAETKKWKTMSSMVSEVKNYYDQFSFCCWKFETAVKNII